MTDIFMDKVSSRGLARSKPSLTIRWQQLAWPLGIFLVILLPRVLTLSTFLTADEDDQIMFAHLFLKSALQGNWAGALVLGYPGVPTLILGAAGVGLRYLFHYAGWLPLPWATANLTTTLNQVTTQFGVFSYPLDFLPWVRLPLALTASLSIFGIYLLAKHLLDERLALLVTLIIAFDPFILAHTRVVHVDGPMAYFMFLSFLAFILYLDQGGWKWLLLSGLFGGLATLSKTPAVLLGPILVLSGLCYALFPPPGLPRSLRWKRLGLALVVWGIVAVGAFFALWPSMWTRPWFAVEWIIRNIQSVNRSVHPTSGIFWGGRQTDQNPLYYTLVFPYHLTPLTTAGVIGGLGMMGAGLVAYWRKTTGIISDWLIRVLPLTLSLVAYVVVFITPVSTISRRGDRYILPVFFASGLFSALALWWLASLLIKYLPPLAERLKLTPARLGGTLVLLQTFLVLLYHPYYLTYFNPVMGGHRTAPYRINVGWGEGLDLAARYLNESTGVPKPQVAAWYSGQFAPYYHGPTIDLSNHSSALTGEYAVFYINQVQRGFPSRELLSYFQQRDPVQVIKIGGIAYAWIYEGPVVSQTAPENYLFPVGVLLGGGAYLTGLDVPQTTMPVDAYAFSAAERKANAQRPYAPLEGIPVTLYWETVGRIAGEHNIYLRLVDDEGNIWGQVDRMILSGLWRPDRWYAGYFLRDEYKLPLDPATPPGTYHFEVGMYDFVTGQSHGIARSIGEITLVPPARITPLDELDLPTMLSSAIDESLTLVGHDYSDSQLPPGAEVVGKIYWQTVKPMEEDYWIEFSLLGPNRKEYVIAEMPLSPSYPTSRWRRSEIVGGGYRFHIPAVAPPGEYPLVAHVIDPQTGERLGSSTPLANITIESQERNFELPQGVAPITAYVNNEIELVGYKLSESTVGSGESFDLTLYWRSLNFADASYTIFVHAVGPDQVIRGQWDSIPVQGASPTSGWIPGEIIQDHYEIPMTPDAPPWKYDIFVGMYNALTGQRLPLTSPNAPVSDNRVWLTRVQVMQK
ncbi:MAG: glycosyltransferase family 39 protein [Anaerolineae bacterium]|nr:glycosyltransferase family 39 protein [Anaerolineae bacterium]